MNSLKISIVAMLLLSGIVPSFVTAAESAAVAESRAELLVKLRRDTPLLDPAAVHASAGATVIRSFKAIGWDQVRLPEGMSASEGAARYRALPEVLEAEPNGVVRFQPPPTPLEVSDAPLRGHDGNERRHTERPALV